MKSVKGERIVYSLNSCIRRTGGPSGLRLLAVAALALAFVACGRDPQTAAGTGVFVSVTVPQSAGVDQLEVTVSAGGTVVVQPTLVPASPRTLSGSETFRIVLPDS